jgi:hypothetical protein
MLFNDNNNSSKLLFSIPVHEEQDIINNQIENILNNNPNSSIILHVNKSFKNFIPEKTLLIYKNVYVNSNSLNYVYGKGLLWIHINNYLESLRLNINFKYFVILSSNEMFIRNGLIHYIEKYKNGAQIVENNKSIIWHNFKRGIENNSSVSEMLKELKITNIYGGQTEGQFYEKSIFEYISNIYIKYFGNKEISTFETEEIIAQTILKSLDIEYGLPITLQNYSTNIIFTEDIINKIINNDFKIENIQIKENLYSPHLNNDCSSIYSIKRIDRTFNQLRSFLSKRGFILNDTINLSERSLKDNTMNLSQQSGDKELFSGVLTKENTMKNEYKLNTEYYSNGFILKFKLDNIEQIEINLKKYKSDKINFFNWVGYEIKEGYYFIKFYLKINKPLNQSYINKIGLKLHSPYDILYNYFFNNIELNEWKYVEIPIHLLEKQKIIFIFDEYLDDLDIDFKNIQIIPLNNSIKSLDKKSNIIISLYENQNNYNYLVNYPNILNTIIEPFSKLYNVYISISISEKNSKINELVNNYKPFLITYINKNTLNLSKRSEDKENTDNKLLNHILLKNMNDINNFIYNNNIDFKFIIYFSLDSIFNISISNINFYINKINFLSYHIPYINNIVSNSDQFISIPCKYLNNFIKILYENLNDSNIIKLLYSKLKKSIENANFNFIYNDNYSNNIRTPLINYLSDLNNVTEKGYIFENKYYYYIYYSNSDSKIFLTTTNEFYFYKNKTIKYTPYLWIGTYLNYIKDNKNELINIKIEFSIKLLKKIYTNTLDFGLKIHEPISYYNYWLNDCIIDNYTKIEINVDILSKSQYILLNFDNYLNEVEFYIKDFKIIL